ncbi:BRCT domain-containing protein [uncultured Draconibacterium sp.]|uniref:BRCT domain-containing protein n=1 Tax=uncultured Draconibacterium sp. TaxID=1573823 RepID=UPI0029C68ADD|nr:BRCT domain-containing protein [uncultured Draconibacterium sp.]
MDKQIKLLAVQYAIAFSEENEIPAKYKRSTGKSQRADRDSNIKRKFEAKINDWETTLRNIKQNVHESFSHCFIHCIPTVTGNTSKVTECEDFYVFNEYVSKRRNEDISYGELGCLVTLLTAFQEKIEEKIGIREPRKLKLKNEEAQKLLDLGTITMDGVELNLWQGHSIDTVKAQEGWNKLKEYSSDYLSEEDIIAHVYFTGAMQIPRPEAEGLATKLGFKTEHSLNKKVEFVIAGSENVGPTKIAKIKKLKESGHKIRVMGEMEFLEMAAEYID